MHGLVRLFVAVAISICGTCNGAAARAVEGPRDVSVRRDVTFSEVDGTTLQLDVYTPSGLPGPLPAVVLVHGGEWNSGTKEYLDPEARKLAQAGFVAIPVDYRTTSPGWPGELHDVQQAVAWVSDHANELGVDPDRIALFGASSGAHLAALVGALGTSGDPTTSQPSGRRVRAVVSYSGILDLTELRDGTSKGLPPAIIAGFLGCSIATCPDRYDEASPIQHVDATTAPMFLAGSTDEVVPADQATRMADALDAAGVANTVRLVDGDQHGLAAPTGCTTDCPHGYRDEVWDDTISFLTQQLSTAEGAAVPTTGTADDRETATGSTTSSAGDWIPFAVIAIVIVAVAATGVLVVRRRSRSIDR